MGDAFHQTQPSVGGQKPEIGLGGLEAGGIAGRLFPVKFPFFRHGTFRIGSQGSASLDQLGKHAVDHGQIRLPDPSLFEERGEPPGCSGRFCEKDKARSFPVETVDWVYVSVPFPQKGQERIAEVSARGVHGEIPRFADGQKLGGFIFHGE